MWFHGASQGQFLWTDEQMHLHCIKKKPCSGWFELFLPQRSAQQLISVSCSWFHFYCFARFSVSVCATYVNQVTWNNVSEGGGESYRKHVDVLWLCQASIQPDWSGNIVACHSEAAAAVDCGKTCWFGKGKRGKHEEGQLGEEVVNGEDEIQLPLPSTASRERRSH